MKNILHVSILGHQYPVEANAGDELYVNRLAQYVESKMREMKEESQIIDSYKLAVLTAMNIADELFRLQDAKGHLSKADSEKMDGILKLLDTVSHDKRTVDVAVNTPSPVPTPV